MSEAKCSKCGGSAIADTYEQARNRINHAVGLGRGIKCGDSYGWVTEINPPPLTATPKVITQKPTQVTQTKVIQKPKETQKPTQVTDSPIPKQEKQSTPKK